MIFKALHSKINSLSFYNQGVLFLATSVTLFSLMDAVAKALGDNVEVIQILWARFLGQFIIIFILCAPRLKQTLKTDYLPSQFVRSFLQLGAAACFFTSLKSITLTEATAITDLAPVFITLGAGIFLGENVGYKRLTAVGIALIGGLLIIRPGTGVFDIAALWPLATALFLTAFALITRRIASNESPITALLYSGAICAVITSIIVPIYWVPVSNLNLFLLVLIGCIGTLAQLMVLKAYAIAEASAIAPITYVGLITATIWSILFFGEYPDLMTIIGSLVIIGSGVYVWHRERRFEQS